MIVYVITNKINGKRYVGQTIHTTERRWREHTWIKNGCRALRNAISKYGKDNFTIGQVDSANLLEKLNKNKKEWIVKGLTFSRV